MAALSITPANVVKISGIPRSDTVASGVTITAGKIITFVNNEAVLASNASEALSGGGGLAIAINSASAGQPVSSLENGAVDLGISSIEGSFFVLGVDGAILPSDELSEDDWLSILGYGNSSDYLVFNPTVSGTQRPALTSLA